MSNKKLISERKRRTSTYEIQHFEPENALKCPMCLDSFETPRALACLHTFCEPCLGFYLTDTKASAKDGKLDKIECPICGHFTVPQNLMKHPHAMVKDLPLNHYILPHLDVLTPRGRNSQLEKRKRNVTFAQCCGSCSERGFTKEAISYCQDCEDFQCGECVENHSKIKVLLNHNIVTIEKVTSSSQSASGLDKHNHCLEHQHEEARFYCTDHDTLLCSLCAMANHKACELIGEFDVLGQKIKDTGEVDKMDENMKNLQNALNDMIEAVRTNNYHIKRETEEIPKRIQTVKAKVLQMFQTLEDTVEAKIKEFEDEHGTRNVDKAFKCKQLMSAIEGSNASLNTAIQHGSNSQLFWTFLKLKTHVQQYDHHVKSEKDSLTCSSINLKIDDMFDKIITTTEQLGKVYVESVKPDLAALPPLLFAKREFIESTSKPQLIQSGQIATTDANVTKDCLAVAYMDKKLALAIEVRKRSWFSYTFSFVNTETLVEIYTQDLKRNPGNIICIDNNNLAITFPANGFIEFYLYTPKRKKRPMSFVLDHTIKCDIKEAVISRYNKTTFGLSTRNYFATLTHDGVMKQIFYYSVSLRTRESDFWSTQLQVDHIAVDFKKKRIYAACSKPSKLYSFTTKGEVMFEYNIDENVRGLELDTDGNISVLCGNHSRGSLRQISPNTGKVLREIKTEAKNPKKICFNRRGGDFYVISNEPDKIKLEKYRFNTEDEEELFDED
ncbi:hypothetical protein ACF0H5_015801 [Mactra antiquata]